MRSTEERRRFHQPWPSSASSVPWTRLRSRTLVRVVSFCILSCACVSAEDYVVPQATLEALTPRGLRVSIPDSWGVQLFAFHGNINKPMRNLEAGDLSVDITSKTGDRWVYINDRVRLKIGDVINYWTYVKVNGLGYRLDDRTWQVTELVSGDSPIGSSAAFSVISNTSTEDAYTTPSNNGNFAGSSSNFGGSGSNSNSSPGTGSSSNYPGTGSNSNFAGTGSNSNYPGSGSNSNFGSFGAPTNPSNNEAFTHGNGGGSSNTLSSSNAASNRPTTTNTRPTGTSSSSGNFGSNNRPIDTWNSGDFGGSRPSGNIGDTDSSHFDRPKPAKTQTSRPPTPPPAPAQHCVLSTTTVNGQPACKNYVIFEETFKNVDLRRWARDIRIPSHPDFEFCVFSDEPDTLWVENDALHIRPRLTEDRYGEDFVRTGNLVLDGCTAGPTNAESCSRQAVFSYILPPTLSARVSTKDSFRFRYGFLEIRAKLPLGDWIYPEILLLPYAEHYGPGISSGRVQLAMARGNRQLSSSRETRGAQLGAKRLEYGVMAGSVAKILHRDANRQWADQFHNYSLLWTPETMAFSVDGVEFGIIRPESYGGLLRSDNARDPWSNGDVLAPFDKEFYLSLGVAVGGVRTFPDDTVTGGAEGTDKPWSNTDAKAMLRFWNAKEQWHPTWGNKSELIIQSIRITALNH